MTDTPTPPMTQKQRALLVGWLRKPYDCTHGEDATDMSAAADQLEADGVTIATLTAERDAARAEIARLTAALAMAREDDGNPRPIETAPKDGTMLRLLVDYEGVENWMPLTDDNQSWTIGFNTLEDTGDDEWIIAGWNWSQDCFGTGEGKVIGWLPFAAITKGTAT